MLLLELHGGVWDAPCFGCVSLLTDRTLACRAWDLLILLDALRFWLLGFLLNILLPQRPHVIMRWVMYADLKQQGSETLRPHRRGTLLLRVSEDKGLG